jgi:hypothetical protein
MNRYDYRARFGAARAAYARWSTRKPVPPHAERREAANLQHRSPLGVSCPRCGSAFGKFCFENRQTGAVA